MVSGETGGDQSDMNQEKLRLSFGCSVNPELSTETQRDLDDSQTTIEQLCEDSSNGNVFDTLIYDLHCCFSAISPLGHYFQKKNNVHM